MSGVAHRRRSVRNDGVVGSDWNLSFSSLLVSLCSATRDNGVGVVTTVGSLGACSTGASPSEVSSSNETSSRGPLPFAVAISNFKPSAKVVGDIVDLLKTIEKISMNDEEVENSHSQCSKVSESKKMTTRVKG
ncbi:hypothetical protein ALC53_02472 [Atta colombica]|uniref:Uncharacterized protein n=1 Tax=Atta colombica TaxID=520822 RepID=A0A195BQV4_9HYME|nr:hypothetical protein ALC53_02472 [Atta colombica]